MGVPIGFSGDVANRSAFPFESLPPARLPILLFGSSARRSAPSKPSLPGTRKGIGVATTPIPLVQKQAIYLCLETRFNIKKEEIPHKIDAFASALEKMFGESAKLIKIEIMKLAYGKIRIVRSPTRKDALLFTEYIKALGSA